MKAIVIVGFLLATTPVADGGQQSLDAAKNLYAAAAYEDALTTFRGLYDGATPDVKQQIDEYRVFCLYALGRRVEAEAAAESLIRGNPLIKLDEIETSPRIQAMFAGVRKRLLPDLIRNEYRTARSARDAKNPKVAEPHFVITRNMLDEAREIGAWSDALAELSELVDGFLDLARSTPPASANPPVAMDAAAAPAPVTASRQASVSQPTPQPPSVPIAKQSQGSGGAPVVYDSSSQDIAPPVTIRQAVPTPPRQLLEIMRANRQRVGKLEVLIDETGAVQDVAVRESVNSNYDEMILMAARNWTYQPAMKDGTPVRYLKVVNVTIGGK